jgi:hypothetical protein
MRRDVAFQRESRLLGFESCLVDLPSQLRVFVVRGSTDSLAQSRDGRGELVGGGVKRCSEALLFGADPEVRDGIVHRVIDTLQLETSSPR